MTTRPLRKAAGEEGFRVLPGRRPGRRGLAPWMVVVLVAVVGFLGLGFARTSLDKTAFELSELDRAIAVEEALNQQLRLDIARLENPARIAPLAEEQGLILPERTNQILVNLDPIGPTYASADRAEDRQ